MKNFRINLNYKFLYIFFILNVFSHSFPCFSEIILKEELKNNNNNIYDKNKYIDKSDRSELFVFFNYFQHFIANLPANLNVIDIESDIQSRIGTQFIAEGNVTINFKGMQVKADKFIYDRKDKKLTLIGKILFKKGSQYFEATEIYYDLKNEIGFIENIYGLLNPNNFNNDLGLKINSKSNNTFDGKINNLETFNNDSFGIVNRNNSNKTFNLNIPEINIWRFKSPKIIIEPNHIKSNQIFFTNDAYNEPQFFVESYNFKGDIKDKKIKFVSKNTWLNFDDKFRLPIGKSSFINSQEFISRWGFGYNNEDKDGFFIKRGFDKKQIFGNKSLKINSYFLVQRGLKGETTLFDKYGNSTYRKKNNFIDLFALDTKLNGKLKNWDLDLSLSNNSLDLNKIKDSSRIKLNLKKSFLVNENNRNLNIKFSSSFREKINKGFSGEEEIYRSNTFTIENKNNKKFKNNSIYLSTIYELGNFNAKSSEKEELIDLFRNLFIGEVSQDIEVWNKKDLRGSISKDYKYSPRVIAEGIKWKNSIKSALFLYSNDESQKVMLLSSGPELTFGSLKNNLFDYTRLSTKAEYILKEGTSPFAFDNVDDGIRIKFNLAQQLFGPIVLNTESYLNLDVKDNDYGKFKESTFGFEIKRRAYNIGLFYKPSSKELGIKFDIVNFGYSGLPPKFNK